MGTQKRILAFLIAALTWGTKWNQTLIAIVLSPTLGAMVGLLLMLLVMWTFHRVSAHRVERFFKVAQLGSSGFLSLAHGSAELKRLAQALESSLAAIA